MQIRSRPEYRLWCITPESERLQRWPMNSNALVEEPKTVLASLNRALLAMMETDPRVVVLGEDVLDPYGGAFKVTREL